jgi:hypothetical protein
MKATVYAEARRAVNLLTTTCNQRGERVTRRIIAVFCEGMEQLK